MTRSVLSVFSGILVPLIAFVVLYNNVVLAFFGWWEAPVHSITVLALVWIVVGLISGVAGGVLASWLAPNRQFLHVGIAAALTLAIALWGQLAGPSLLGQPMWHQWFMVALGPGSILLGGQIYPRGGDRPRGDAA